MAHYIYNLSVNICKMDLRDFDMGQSIHSSNNNLYLHILRSNEMPNKVTQTAMYFKCQ